MSYQIALASSDGTHIDRHFGHSEIFYIAAVAENGSYELIGQRAVDSPCNHGSHDEGAMQAAVTTTRKMMTAARLSPPKLAAWMMFLFD